MNVRYPQGVLHSFSVKNIFYVKIGFLIFMRGYVTSRFLGILANRRFVPNSNNSVLYGFNFNNNSFSINHSDNLFMLHNGDSILS